MTEQQRELDALIEERVFGSPLSPCRTVRYPNPLGGQPIPHYTTDPAADYEVLRHVRETWDREDGQESFGRALVDLWRGRGRDLADAPALWYMPGDYSRAALAALGVEH